MKLASFDIFDTALIRKCGLPENIFYLLSRHLYPQDRALQEDFLVWRRHIGGRVKQISGKAEVCLEDLYRLAEFPGYTPKELAEAELTVEAENLMANPSIRDLIRKRRKEGYTIVFISDMYLPGDFLEKILLREGCCQTNEKVFVSCEYQARKDRGTLYEVVRKQYQPSTWVHCGDHPHSDIKMARKHRIRTEKVESDYTFIERKLMRNAMQWRDPFQLSVLAGFSRAIRMEERNTPEAVLAADFIAPAYLPYVKYILEKARQKQIKRLYFLSRDGFILKQAAEELVSPDMELRELFVSRRSLILPYLALDFSKESYMRIADRNTLLRKKVSHLLWQLGVMQENLQKKYGISFEYERILTQEQENDFLMKLFCGTFREVLLERAEKEKRLILEYFRQEGLMDGVASCFIDIGWLGTSRLMINALLKHAGYPEIETFYYGIRSDVFPVVRGRYESYFCEGMLDTQSTWLLENYFSQSPNPSTCGYRRVDKMILPEWEEGKNIHESSILQNNVRVVRRMAQTLKKYHFSSNELYAWAKLSLDSIADLEGNPDLTPLLQNNIFDDGCFVRKLSFSDIIKIAFGMHVTAYDSGSLQITIGERLRRFIESLHNFAIRYIYPVYRKLS